MIFERTMRLAYYLENSESFKGYLEHFAAKKAKNMFGMTEMF